MLDEAKKVGFKTQAEFDAFVERNKPLKEGFMRQSDYTRKTQELSTIRKSFEEAFGRVPDRNELSALKRVWDAYYQNPQFKETVNALLNGRQPSSQPAQVQPK